MARRSIGAGICAVALLASACGGAPAIPVPARSPAALSPPASAPSSRPATVPTLTDRPASISAAVITGLLRDRLGFQGLVLTDSLSAKALSALGISIPEAAVEAVQAGSDMVMFNSSSPNATFSQVVQALVSAVRQGRISAAALDASVTRVLAVRGVDLCR